MQTNFFIDFATIGTIGLFAGLDFMVVFSIATFLAMVTRYAHVVPSRVFVRSDTKRGNRNALPAFRDQVDRHQD